MSNSFKFGFWPVKILPANAITKGRAVTKKRSKRKNQSMTPCQVESAGRISFADIESINSRQSVAPEKVESVAALGVRGWFQNRFGNLPMDELPVAVPTAKPGPVAGGPAQKAPLLIGGETIPELTTGETSFIGYSDSIVLDRNQNPVIKPGVRCIKGQKVGIDWVSCVFDPSRTWAYDFFAMLQGDDQNLSDEKKSAQSVKNIFSWILGFTSADESAKWQEFSNGLNGYKYAVGMPYRAGVVHVGHASGTVLVTVSGQGASVATPGWENRLYRFLGDVKGWLTRIDMAFDDYEGKYFPVRVMREKAKEGAFKRDNGGRSPKIELRGPWEQDDPENSGLTLYVGARLSGKFTRIYEKGKQLGDESSPWVRAEVELHNSCYQLTLDMLLHPTRWFVAFYPCFEVVEMAADKVELSYRERIAASTLDHSKKWIRHQAGGHLAALRQFFDDSELLDMLCRPEAIPESFVIANKSCESLLAPSASRTDEPGWITA